MDTTNAIKQKISAQLEMLMADVNKFKAEAKDALADQKLNQSFASLEQKLNQLKKQVEDIS